MLHTHHSTPPTSILTTSFYTTPLHPHQSPPPPLPFIALGVDRSCRIETRTVRHPGHQWRGTFPYCLFELLLFFYYTFSLSLSLSPSLYFFFVASFTYLISSSFTSSYLVFISSFSFCAHVMYCDVTSCHMSCHLKLTHCVFLGALTIEERRGNNTRRWTKSPGRNILSNIWEEIPSPLYAE